MSEDYPMGAAVNPLPFEDPEWYSWTAEEHDGGWLLSYVDVLCVVLAMMVVLLGHLMAQHRGAPAVHAPATAVEKPVAPAPAIKQTLAKPLVVAKVPSAPEKARPTSRIKAVTVTPKKTVAPPTPQAPAAAAKAPEHVAVPAVKPLPSPEERLIHEIRTRFAGQVRAVRRDRGVSIQIADVILFESARADLRANARPVLQQLVETLRKLGKAAITVEGHTDDQPVTGGRFHNNWELGAARANAVVAFLIQTGFDPARLRSISYADTRPVANNATAKGRAENRRVELRVEFAAPAKAKPSGKG